MGQFVRRVGKMSRGGHDESRPGQSAVDLWRMNSTGKELSQADDSKFYLDWLEY